MDPKIDILKKYMPANAAPIISRWIDYYKCDFKISKNRSTKYGDYRSPFNGIGHRISINHNLNPFAFLVTTVHEFAHLQTFKEHANRVKPHGVEWKLNFKRMMAPFFELDVFPMDVKKAIIAYLQNPSASSCTDLHLFKTLKLYDPVHKSLTTVDKIPINGLFLFKNERKFKKLEKIRKRYKCLELKTGVVYLFSPVAEVELIPLEN